jgi:hypothetical protein
MAEGIDRGPQDPTQDPGGENAVQTGQTVDQIVLPTMREGESGEEFRLRAERGILNLLERMGVEDVLVIKEELRHFDEKESRAVSLDVLGSFYEDERPKTREDIHGPEVNKDLDRLSVTSKAVADLAALMETFSLTSPEDPRRVQAFTVFADRMEDHVRGKTPVRTYSALGALHGEAMKIEGPSRPEPPQATA